MFCKLLSLMLCVFFVYWVVYNIVFWVFVRIVFYEIVSFCGYGIKIFVVEKFCFVKFELFVEVVVFLNKIWRLCICWRIYLFKILSMWKIIWWDIYRFISIFDIIMKWINVSVNDNLMFVCYFKGEVIII